MTPREHAHDPPLEASPRFAPPVQRRDFLGIAAIWTALAAFVVAAFGALRLPMPAVFPESSAQVKIGPPDDFEEGSVTHLADLNAWIFRDAAGLYAISTICTHLGCVATRHAETGAFTCPCHGSVFEGDGRVTSGPAPSGLNWLHLSVAPDGKVVLDRQRTVTAGTRLTV